VPQRLPWPIRGCQEAEKSASSAFGAQQDARITRGGKLSSECAFLTRISCMTVGCGRAFVDLPRTAVGVIEGAEKLAILAEKCMAGKELGESALERSGGRKGWFL
jgi:hypothetical protein